MSRNSVVLIVALLALLIAAPASAGEFRVAWDYGSGGPEPDLAGLKLYYGAYPRMYGNAVHVNDLALREYTFTNMKDGVYYVAATVYDTLGNESGFSNEVVKVSGPNTAPAALKNLRGTL